MTLKRQTWTSFSSEPLADADFLAERPDVIQIDESTIDRACRDNPDLPRSFVADTFQSLAEARAGNTTPFVPRGKKD